MKEKFNQFFSKHNGQFLEVNDPTNKYMCMDLAYAFCDFLQIPRDTIRHLYAKEVYTKATDLTKQYFDLIPNSPEGIPEVGDLVVFNTGTAGHISIRSNGKADTKNFESFDQNYGTPKSCRLVIHTYTGVVGWLRPKVELDMELPKWFATLLQESGLSLDNEGAFRAFWDKGVKFDDETKGLKQQVVSANEALADRAREVSVLTESNQRLSDKVDETTELLNTARDERDKANWEKDKTNVVNKTIREENESLKGKIKKLQENNDIMAYGFWERLFSLFRR